MRRLVLTILAALTLTACRGGVKPSPKLNPGDTALPGGTYDVRQPISAALRCPVAEIQWSIVEPACGHIAGGLFTAPACGSACVPGTAHIRGSGCGKVAEVPVTIAEEIVGVEVCGVAAGSTCCAKVSALPPGGTAQFYATVLYGCPNHVEYSPSAPPTACL